MNIFLLHLPAIIFFGMIIAIAAFLYGTFYRHYRKMRLIYDTIQVGDQYQCNVPAMHPFDKPMVYKATIIAKAMAGKYPWVQYRYDDGSISQDELDEFLACHEKIN